MYVLQETGSTACKKLPSLRVAPSRKKFSQFEDKIGKYSHGTRVRNPVASFAGMMTRMDRGVGKVLDLLNELKIQTTRSCSSPVTMDLTMREATSPASLTAMGLSRAISVISTREESVCRSSHIGPEK